VDENILMQEVKLLWKYTTKHLFVTFCSAYLSFEHSINIIFMMDCHSGEIKVRILMKSKKLKSKNSLKI